MSTGQTFVLDELLQALHNAVLETQKLTEEQYFRVLKRYFMLGEEYEGTMEDADIDDLQKWGEPRKVELNMPFLKDNEDDESEILYKTVEVPLITLVPLNGIKIKNVKVSCNAQLTGFEDESKSKEGFQVNKILKADNKIVMPNTSFTTIPKTLPKSATFTKVGDDRAKKLQYIKEMIGLLDKKYPKLMSNRGIRSSEEQWKRTNLSKALIERLKYKEQAKPLTLLLQKASKNPDLVRIQKKEYENIKLSNTSKPTKPSSSSTTTTATDEKKHAGGLTFKLGNSENGSNVNIEIEFDSSPEPEILARINDHIISKMPI